MPHDRQRALATIERLLATPIADLAVALDHATDAVADALGADKVDAFLHDPARDSLVAVGTSHQPLSDLERRLGLDVLPVANGGRVVEVFRTGVTTATGRLDLDADEVVGIREALAVRSQIGVALEVGGVRRGVLMVASQRPDLFSDADVRFAETVARWVAIVARQAELVAEIGRAATESGRRAAAEELVTVLAHDLRNHVSPISLRLQVLRRRAERDRRADDLDEVRRAQQGLERLSSMIEDLLDVARVDQGALRMDLRPLELVGLVEETAALLRSADHPIEVLTGEAAIPIVGDATRLRQCLENLLSNAQKHSPHGAPVVVELERAPREDGFVARVEVIDQGPGVAADVLPRLFERFATGDRGAGLGLGLYLARSIATLHGGELTVRSSPGEGARFTLLLPA